MGDDRVAVADDEGPGARRNLPRIEQPADGLQVNVDANHDPVVALHRRGQSERRNPERSRDEGPDGHRRTA
ncbi:hypothetical protein D9M72_557840 [compost metagenome]